MNRFRRGCNIAARDKHYLALYREYLKLLKVESDAPLIELDTPYQRGWVRYFRLREDALTRDDAGTLKEVLERVNVYQYCRKGTFTQKHGKSKKLVPIGHHLKWFTVNDARWLKWPERYKKYFELRLLTQVNCNNQIVRNHRCVFMYPQYCVSHIEKYYVTHRRVCMPEVVSRIAELEEYFEQNLVREKLASLSGCSNGWDSKPLLRKDAEYYEIQSGLEERIEDE
ncbi:MAG: hypothetical protein ACSHYA_13805 [Opitutaceae bacterium]